MMVKKENFNWKDEVKGVEFNFTLLPTDQIKIPEIQRDISNQLVERLYASIIKVGFISPIIVYKNETENVYYVIDGQHRFKAAQMAGIKNIPAIIVPSDYANFILTYNIEKPSNLKDKAKQAYRLYKEYLDMNIVDLTEEDISLYIDYPYYVTVGIAIEEINPKFSGSMFESLLKKIDIESLNLELSEAYKERKRRAELLYNLYEKINEIYYETGLKNALIKAEIFRKAFQNVYGKRIRKIEDDYYTSLNKLISELDKNKEQYVKYFSSNNNYDIL
jgi:ParB family chromosome partitioning protein